MTPWGLNLEDCVWNSVLLCCYHWICTDCNKDLIYGKRFWYQLLLLLFSSVSLPALFQKISKFCTFLSKFSNILPFFNIFFKPFFWKIVRMPWLSRITPDYYYHFYCSIVFIITIAIILVILLSLLLILI